MIADHVKTALKSEGAEVIGPVSHLNYALRLLPARSVEAAVLDIGLQEEKVFILLDHLAEESVPTVLVAGYDQQAIPNRQRTLQFIQKSSYGRAIVRALSIGSMPS